MQLGLPLCVLAASRDRAPGRAYWVRADGTGKSILCLDVVKLSVLIQKTWRAERGYLGIYEGSESRKQSSDAWRDWNAAVDNSRLFHVSLRQLRPKNSEKKTHRRSD